VIQRDLCCLLIETSIPAVFQRKVEKVFFRKDNRKFYGKKVALETEESIASKNDDVSISTYMRKPFHK